MKLLLTTILTLLCAATALADNVTRYSDEETLWQDTVWQGEVLIDGILTVAPGVTLEIRPGTVVRFTRADLNHDDIGDHELFIQGTFSARGTAEQPILFTSAEKNPQPGDWGTVNMMASPEKNVMEYCQVEYGYRGFHAHFASARLIHSIFRLNRRGAQFQESNITISDSVFADNLNGVQFRDSTVSMRDSVITGGYWGLRCVYSKLEMSGCRIENNLVNGVSIRDSEVTLDDNFIINNRRGLYLQRSQATVKGNFIERNSEHGIFLEDSSATISQNSVAGNGRSGFRIIDSEVSISDNQIIDNDEYALINDGARDVNLGSNWWGTTERNELAIIIRDGADRVGTGRVLLADPLAASPF